MPPVISRKFLATLVGTVVLGAIGSGLWDIAFKPALLWESDILLSIGTLGLKSVQDSIYVEIAKGNYERAALLWFVSAVSMLVGIFFGAFTGLFLVKRGVAEVAARLLPTRALMLITALFAGFLMIGAVRLTYIVRAANHLEQCQRIVAPYMTEIERLAMRSQVALISSRDDYIRTLTEVSSIAKRQAISLPDFDIW